MSQTISWCGWAHLITLQMYIQLMWKWAPIQHSNVRKVVWKHAEDSWIQQFAIMCFILSRQKWKCSVTPALNTPAEWIHTDGSVSEDYSRYWWVWIAPCRSLCLSAFKVISWLRFTVRQWRLSSVQQWWYQLSVECGINWKSRFANESAFLSTLKSSEFSLNSHIRPPLLFFAFFLWIHTWIHAQTISNALWSSH